MKIGEAYARGWCYAPWDSHVFLWVWNGEISAADSGDGLLWRSVGGGLT